jgi:hypothetical protein
MTGENPQLLAMARALATREQTLAWLRGLSPEELGAVWEACPDARALFRLVAPVTPPKVLVRVCCACLRHVLDQRVGHHRIRKAVKLLEQWSNDAAPFADFEAAAAKIDEAAHLEDLTIALGLAASTAAERMAEQLALAMSNEGTVYAGGKAPPLKTRAAALAQLAAVVRRALPCPDLATLIGR